MKYLVAVVLWVVASSPEAWAQSREQAASPDVNPGLWEITVQLVAPISGEPTTSEICIANDQAKIKVPKTKAKDDCQATETPSASNEVAYTIQCQKLKRSTTAKFAYYGDHYDGISTTTMNGVEFKMKYTAKRLGACDASSQDTGVAR